MVRSQMKKPPRHAAAQAKMAMALSLTRFGVSLVRKKAKERRPGATAREIERIVDLWYRRRPGAELGDCDAAVSRVRRWPTLQTRSQRR